MTGAEPSTKVTTFANRHTPKMSAHSEHDEPLWRLCTSLIRFGVPKTLDIDRFCLFNLIGSTMPDEDGLSTPFDNDVLSFRNGTEGNFDFGEGKDVCSCGHAREEIGDRGLCHGSREDSQTSNHEIRKSPAAICVWSFVVVKVGDGIGVWERVVVRANSTGMQEFI